MMIKLLKIFLIYIQGLFIVLTVNIIWNELNITIDTNLYNILKISLISIYVGILSTYWCKDIKE